MSLNQSSCLIPIQEYRPHHSPKGFTDESNTLMKCASLFT